MSQLEPFLPLLQLDALTRTATPKAFLAGQELFKKGDRVRDLVLGDREVRGKIKGESGAEHQTRLELAGRGKKLTCHCTCPTFMDGWEMFCQHAVAMALSLRQQHEAGKDFSTTNNPWVEGAAGDGGKGRRIQLERKRGQWWVKTFNTGSAGGGSLGKKTRTRSPMEQLIEGFLDQAVDEDEDTGALVLEPVAVAGLLYAAREANISLKGAGRLRFSNSPLVLRVEASTQDHTVDLHAFLEHTETQRTFEVSEGLVLAGAPTWFLWPETGEAFMVHDTPPWVLTAVAEKAHITMDTRVDAEDMDRLTEQLQAVGVPQHDLFALASDARAVDEIIATISGEGERIKVELGARYDNITLPIEGADPESARYSFTHGKETIAFYRDLDTEAQARKVLAELKLRWNSADGAFSARGDDAIEFMVAGIPLLPEDWEKRIPTLPRIRSKSPSSRVSVKNPGGSVLEVEAIVDVEGDEDLLNFRDLLRWLHDGRRWITLNDGSVVKLDPKILKPIADAAGAMQFDKDGKAELNTLELGALSKLLSAVPTAEVAKDVRKLMDNMVGERAARAPRKAKALTAKLRDYQKSGYAWLWQLHQNQMTGILADDMGLGKTVQAIALLAKAKESEGDAPSLIVCPTSVLSVWYQEIKKWAPSMTVLVWHGPERAEHARLLKRVDVVVTSYTILRRDIDDLSKIRFRYGLLDEAQYIKNWNTGTAKSARQLKTDHRLALTGTPVENHIIDLWAIFDFLAPGFLGKLGEFQKNYVKPIENGDVDALESLRTRVRPFIMRRRKEDVASELPPKTEQTLYVQFNRQQLALYNKILKVAKTEIEGRISDVGVEKSQMTILAALTRLRQVCTDPKLMGLPKGQTVPPSAKLEAFEQLMGDLIGAGRKVLVFSQFVKMQEILVEKLKEMDIEHLWLHGGTKNRADLVERFQRKDGPPVFLISLKAGGSGLTLTEADTVIHYDPWWNPAVEDQATDRAHRIGQEKPVFVYRMVMEDTVEQKMVELGQEKRRIAESALGRDTTTGKKLTMDDVERLLDTPATDPWQDL